MAEIKIAGIMRAGAHSPNHIGNDTAIFNMVVEQLRKRGCEVRTYSEEQFNSHDLTERIIVNMCREERSVQKLQKLEDDGCIVINSGYGIENTLRERMTRILLGNNIPYPESLFVNTDEGILADLRRLGINQCWIKRGDYHAMHNEDVSYVSSKEQAQEVLQEYFIRGIKRAVITRHLPGQLLKFYGVSGQDFFYTAFPFLTDKEQTPPISLDALHDTCERAADAIGIEIYGGDCIVDPDGNFTIIDFNDWPSFTPCRAQASQAIARRIMAIIKTRGK